jgi:hypothetical protein
MFIFRFLLKSHDKGRRLSLKLAQNCGYNAHGAARGTDTDVGSSIAFAGPFLQLDALRNNQSIISHAESVSGRAIRRADMAERGVGGESGMVVVVISYLLAVGPSNSGGSAKSTE